MAKKQLPPVSEEEFHSLIHQIIKRMILVGLGAVLLGLLVIAALYLWQHR